MGKACSFIDAVSYTLSQDQRKKYAEFHPQVAPEVHDGLAPQSTKSDTYAYGRVLSQMNTVKLQMRVLCTLSSECLSTDYKRRPTTSNLFTFMRNLFSVPS